MDPALSERAVLARIWTAAFHRFPPDEGEAAVNKESKAVFLSYASQDAQAVRRIAEALRAAGVEVWFDQNELVGGDAWDAKIRKQIAECALFVPVISAATQARGEGYFRLEWKLAVDRSHLMAHDQPFLLPVVIDATRDPEARVPAEFRAVQWTRLPGGEASTSAFCERVKNVLGGLRGASVPLGDLERGSDRRAAASAHAPGSERRVTPAGSAGRANSRRWLTPMLAAVVALAALIAWRPWRRTEDTISHPPKTEVAARATSNSNEESAVTDKSVVVLPLENLSPDPDNAFFTDGMHAEIIATLQRATALKVIGRDSSLLLKRGSGSLSELAARVGAAHVITGSVRRAGDKVRILLELRRARDEALLWSSPSAERGLKDVFALQSEIADEVARVLQAREATGTNANARFLTKNLKAYDLMLKTNAIFFSFRPEALNQAIALCTEAHALDPDYVLPVFMLAGAYGNLLNQESDPEKRAALAAQMKRWAELAAEMDPNGVGANAMVFYLSDVEMDFTRALEYSDKALRALPNDTATPVYRGYALLNLGRVSETRDLFHAGTTLDPLKLFLVWNEVDVLTSLRRNVEARAAIEQVEAAARGQEGGGPNFIYARTWAHFRLAGQLPDSVEGMEGESRARWLWRARRFAEAEKILAAEKAAGGANDVDRFTWQALRHDVLVRLGRVAEAADVGQQLAELARRLQTTPELGPSKKAHWQAQALIRTGNPAEAIAAARQCVAAASPTRHVLERWQREFELAKILAVAGRPAECVEVLAKLLRVPCGLTVPMLRVDPMWDNVRDDVAFKALLIDPKNSAPL